ncbi:hypothetical protein TSAR_012878 [Trichomalopsis sarcophagae]|uniref:Uncharacterized protein n=1 Tax=Trichomalopsis sarcophagae TaxID=543379 RepID=A0A232EPP0_9HYME|nr:hypothetical protein TSAR_012878 [Trichomalopsis sarcophagae]
MNVLILKGIGNYSNSKIQLVDNRILEFNAILKFYSIFDMQSAYKQTLDLFVVKRQCHEFLIALTKIQYKTNYYDCDVYAIAFAVAIVFNICPCKAQLNIIKMRKHLIRMYDTLNLSFFQISKDYKNNIYFETIAQISIIKNITHAIKFSEFKLYFDIINIILLIINSNH